MVIWIKFAHSHPLIPKMLMFTLVISFLAKSNLPWFMYLIFQLPMQYCSLQHRTLLSPPDTSTTLCCFLFGLALSFLLELFLGFVFLFVCFFFFFFQQCIGQLLTWGVHLSVSYLFAFLYCSCGSQGKNAEVVCHFLLQVWVCFSNKWKGVYSL